MSEAKILIVDDDAQIRRTLRATLVPHGYEVQDASGGDEALQLVRESKPDLVLLDLNMPGLGGLETCRAIREFSDVAIIVLTVRDEEKDKVRMLDAGADDYVTKPFGAAELLARIRAALRRMSVSNDGLSVLELDGLTIDFGARQVMARGQAVRLTPKEFDLLRYLAGNANQVVTHRRLLQAVWGPEYGDEVEYLRVFVNQLRKKIEKHPSEPKFLLTEPWVGYQFRVPSGK